MKTIAEFTITYRQYLQADGTLSEDCPSDAIPPQKTLIALYRWMTLTRLFDQKAIKLQRTGQLGTYASTLGQEAISVGYGYAMQADDILVPYYRDYGAQLQRGTSMTELLRYWGGDERGNDFSQNRHDFPLCVPIASQLLHAAGVAKAIQYQQRPGAVVTTCGDGATSQGDFYEALNVAGAWQLPFVLIVNNNQWAISVSRRQQTHARTLAQKAIAAGIPCEQVDGNDVLAVLAASRDALARARTGQGPSFIEAISYRLCDHTTADDAQRYVPEQALSHAWKNEPLSRLQHYLETACNWSAQDQSQLEQESKQQVEAAVQEYLNTPDAPVTDLFDYLYAELPPCLDEQRQLAQQQTRAKK